MSTLGEFVKSADWKSEKHVPVIEAPEAVASGEYATVTVSVGKQIAHPNTTEHHIAWIALHFVADGAKVSCELGRFEFSAHGQSAAGPNLGPAYTDGSVAVRVKLGAAGTLFATAYCNIHGLWEASKPIRLA